MSAMPSLILDTLPFLFHRRGLFHAGSGDNYGISFLKIRLNVMLG